MVESGTDQWYCCIMNTANLAAWHASPMSIEDAQALLQQTQSLQRQAYLRAEDNMEYRVRELIARYWLGRRVEGDYKSILGNCAEPSCSSLAHLVYGQLLMARKISGAMDYLRMGFDLASGLFAAADYFTVLRRHELLAYLPLSEQGSEAMPLEDLLREAAVIRRLQEVRNTRRGISNDPKDTVG